MKEVYHRKMEEGKEKRKMIKEKFIGSLDISNMKGIDEIVQMIDSIIENGSNEKEE